MAASHNAAVMMRAASLTTVTQRLAAGMAAHTELQQAQVGDVCTP